MSQPDFKTDPQVIALTPVAENITKFAHIAIKSAQNYADAATILKSIKGALMQIEDARTRITKPLNDSLREVNTQAKAAALPFLTDELLIKKAMLRYAEEMHALKELEQRKANEVAAKEQARLKAIADRAAEKGQDAKAELFESRAQMVVAPVVQHAAPKVAGVSMRDVWKFEVIDVAAINPAFLMADEVKIRKLVTSMQKNAAAIVGPGVRIWSEKQVASTSS